MALADDHKGVWVCFVYQRVEFADVGATHRAE
jgi:hypothetical protein